MTIGNGHEEMSAYVGVGIALGRQACMYLQHRIQEISGTQGLLLVADLSRRISSCICRLCSFIFDRVGMVDLIMALLLFCRNRVLRQRGGSLSLVPCHPSGPLHVFIHPKRYVLFRYVPHRASMSLIFHFRPPRLFQLNPIGSLCPGYFADASSYIQCD